LATTQLYGNEMRVQRKVAPGEIELGSAAALQFVAALALLFASPHLLAGNGTALLTAASYPTYTGIVKTVWGLIFAYAGYMAVRAITKPSVKNRRIAWQVIIPLWACWWTGLAFPLVIGRDTNVVVLAAVFFFINQWILTRLFVPLNGHWYDRIYHMRLPGRED
jgi:hypothetical protein